MQKTILFLAAFLAGVILDAAPENPVYKMFSKDITFALNFDNGTCEADLASGKSAPLNDVSRAVIAENGLFGKGLARGTIKFDAKKNADLLRPGTIILWLCPLNWPEKKPADGIEPGFYAMLCSARTPDYDYSLVISKIRGQQWGQGHFNTYIQYYVEKNKPMECLIYGRARASLWKNGEWKMIAVTWNSGNFAASVNGSKSTSAAQDKIFRGEMTVLQIGVEEKNYRVMVDEVTILNRALSDGEIKKLYDATVQTAHLK